MNQAYEKLEKLAKEFKKDTGLLAPFKDAPAAASNDPHYDRGSRQQEWDKWLKHRQSHATLTEMLRAAFMVQLECDANAQAIEDDLIFIKDTFKDWLRTVGLPHQMSEESTRQLLITLVDEP